MSDLRKSVIRLANAKPELRVHLVPLLRKEAMKFDTQKALEEYKKTHDVRPSTKLNVKKKEDGGKEDEGRGKGKGKGEGASSENVEDRITAELDKLEDADFKKLLKEHANLPPKERKQGLPKQIKNRVDDAVETLKDVIANIKEMFETGDRFVEAYARENPPTDTQRALSAVSIPFRQQMNFIYGDGWQTRDAPKSESRGEKEERERQEAWPD